MLIASINLIDTPLSDIISKLKEYSGSEVHNSKR